MPRRLSLLVALVALAACTAGCEDTVDPTLGTEQAFSVYGYLDPTADRQALRVVPIEATLGADTTAAVDAEVTSVEPATGRTAAWRDSAVTYADGTVAHIFVADYTPTPGAEVAVTVRASDGREAVVTVEAPPLAQPSVAPPSTAAGDVTYPIELAAPRVLTTELVYRVVGLPEAPNDTVAVPYEGPRLEERTAGLWALDLPFVTTSRAFLAELGAGPLRLVDVTVRAFVANAGWAVPPGGFDLDAIVEPGTFSNVGGGFGFVGAGYWTERRWEPSLVTQSRAGFTIDEDPATSLFLNEVSADGWVELYNPTLEPIPVAGYTLVAGPDATLLLAGTFVEPGGFLVVDIGPGVGSGSVAFLDPSGDRVRELGIPSLPDGELGTYGAFPDGYSHPLNELPAWRGYDLFRGLTAPTPGAANQIGTALATVNEVFTAGSNGWVEVYAGVGITNARITSAPDRPVFEWRSVPIGPDRFGTASEVEGPLDLGQSGGELFVLIWLRDKPPRVVDVRSYGPQSPTRSSGLLPDGDLTGWQSDLLPTRGAPNAAARFAHP